MCQLLPGGSLEKSFSSPLCSPALAPCRALAELLRIEAWPRDDYGGPDSRHLLHSLFSSRSSRKFRIEAPFLPPELLLSPSLASAYRRRQGLSRSDRRPRLGPPRPPLPSHRRIRAGVAGTDGIVLDLPASAASPPAVFPAIPAAPRRSDHSSCFKVSWVSRSRPLPLPSPLPPPIDDDHHRTPPLPCSRPGPALGPVGSG